MNISSLRRPPIRPIVTALYYERGPEDPELSRVIWMGLFRLKYEEDLIALHFCDYSRFWELLGIEKPEWWTGNFSDARHELYRRPITRFVYDCYRERPFFKYLHTQIQHLCTPEEFDEKWRNGEFYALYNSWV